MGLRLTFSLNNAQADEKTYQDSIADCQAERGKADAEVALCEDRDAMMQLEIAELQRWALEPLVLLLVLGA